MPRTGISGTLTLTGGSTFTARYKSISAPSFSIDALDDTALVNSSGFYESVPDDLAKAAPITAQFYASLNDAIPVVGAVASATITFPLQEAMVTPAIVSGSAIITRVDMPELSAGTLMMGSIELTFDGKTGPAFAAGTGGV